MVIATAIALIRSGRVQTAITQYLTLELSRGLHADVHIDKVKIRFFNRLEVQGVYLSDQAGDTLLAIPRLSLTFNPWALETQKLHFPTVEVIQPYIFLKQDSASTNIDYLLHAFASDQPDTTNFDYIIGLDAIHISDARIRYRHIPTDNDVLISRVQTDIHLPYLTRDSVEADLANLQLRLQLHGVDAYAEAAVHGTMDSLFADRLEVVYRGERMLLGQMQVRNFLNWKQMQTTIDCQDLYANRPLLQDLLSDVLHHPVQLPEQLQPLGDMHYRGILSGRLENLALHGIFLSQLGSLSTDCILQCDTSFSDIRLQGSLATKRLRIGKLIPRKGLNTIAFKANLDARYQVNAPLFVKGNLHVNSFDYQRYTYHNLHVAGQWEDSIFTGSVRLKDKNADIAFNGKVDASATDPLADFLLQINHLRLNELHLVKACQDQDMHLTCHIDLAAPEGEGQWIDRLKGQILLDSLWLTNNNALLQMQQMILTLGNEDGNSLKIQSDFLNGKMSGDFRWSTLSQTMLHFFHEVMPATFNTKDKPAEENTLDFYFYVKNIDSLLALTAWKDLHVPKTQTIKGFVYEKENSYQLQCHIPRVETGNTQIQNLTFFIEQQQQQAGIGLSMKEHTISYDSTRLRIGDIDVNMITHIRCDSLLTFFAFDDLSRSDDDDSGISIHTRIGKYKRRPEVDVHILPSWFLLRDTVWNLADAHIGFRAVDTTLNVNRFDLHSDYQYMRVNGTASSRMSDSLFVEVNRINLPYFLQYVGLEDAISVDGAVSGWATLYALFSTPMLEANLRIPEAKLNNTSIGEVTATAELDRQTHHVSINADAHLNQRHIVHLTGDVIPEEKYWELFIHADSADLRLVNFWTQGILEDIQGEGYGDLHVFGRRLQTWVTAAMYARNAGLTIPYTGVRYYLSDSIKMDTTSISFPNIRIRDAQGHTGIVNGILTHELFKDFHYQISADVNDILALDIPYSSQQMYYGKVYASGSVDIHGDENETYINVYARTRANTDFYLCVNTASDAADNSFIEFVDNTPVPLIVQPAEQPKKPASKSNFYLSMAIDATPDATMHVTLDSHNADGIVGKGEGNLRLTMDANSDVRLYGTYTLQQGTFSYAVGNLLRRDFQIVSGSSVSWSGDPLSPILNASAKYRVTASLRDLFGDDLSQLATNRTSVPVECVLYITDKLFNPVLRFGIELPQSDEAIASQVKAVINSDEMLMRQVVYLLAFNRFFTPEYMQNTTSGVNETYALLSSTVTGQINAWLSRLTDVVQVGFNFRTDGEGSTASQEYETQFQLHPVNRLSINGNFGYRYNDLSNRPFYGDVDIEYQLTPNGKIRAKAFTHTVDKYSLKQAETVQGVGFVFRHDFNRGDAQKRRQTQGNP